MKNIVSHNYFYLINFKYLFNTPSEVLFTFPSWYLLAIGIFLILYLLMIFTTNFALQSQEVLLFMTVYAETYHAIGIITLINNFFQHFTT
jgi:hypothetical protein